MRKILIIAGFLLMIGGAFAWAQTAATNVQPGTIATSGCGSAFTCFKPLSSVNPLPVTLNITP